jgi:hypothetical protein
VIVVNVGAQPLSFESPSAQITGPDAADFALGADSCAGLSLAFEQTCTIAVTFTPSSTSAESATLTLSDNEAAPSPSTCPARASHYRPDRRARPARQARSCRRRRRS